MNHLKIKNIITALLIYFIMNSAHAIRLEVFQSNCDLRKLSLTSKQKAELRLIRDDSRKININQNIHIKNTNRQNKDEIIRLLADEPFNYSNAKTYANNRFQSAMPFAVDEIKIQHKIYQLLTPTQRSKWIDTCLQ